MRDTFKFALLLAGLLTISASRASAKVQITNLIDALAQSKTIAIVKLVEPPRVGAPRQPRLNVLRVLRGHLKTGEQVVDFAEYGYPHGPRGEFVAFLDKDFKWRFTAAPLSERKVDSHLLILYGFADDSAHYVSPGYLSLAQLMAFAKTGKLIYSFNGAVWFPQQGKFPWAPSDIRIDGTYDALRDRAHVTGLGHLAGLPEEPSVNMTSRLEIPAIRLTYSNRGGRTLEVRGLVEGIDQRTGALIAKFIVTAPAVLNEATLKKYLADPRLGRCSYKFRLRCHPTKDCPNRDFLLTSFDDDAQRLEGWGSGPLEIDSGGVGESPEDYRVVTESREGRKVVLDFHLARSPNDKDPHWWTSLGGSGLLYDVNSAPVRGKLWLDDGKTLRAITSFSVDLAPVTFGPVFGK